VPCGSLGVSVWRPRGRPGAAGRHPRHRVKAVVTLRHDDRLTRVADARENSRTFEPCFICFLDDRLQRKS
jgi:hypothetical protein